MIKLSWIRILAISRLQFILKVLFIYALRHFRSKRLWLTTHVIVIRLLRIQKCFIYFFFLVCFYVVLKTNKPYFNKQVYSISHTQFKTRCRLTNKTLVTSYIVKFWRHLFLNIHIYNLYTSRNTRVCMCKLLKFAKHQFQANFISKYM